MYRVAGRGKPPQLRSLTPRTPPVQPEPTPQGRRHWCRLTEKYCTRIAPPFQKVPLSPRNLPCCPSPFFFPSLPLSLLLSLSFYLYLYLSLFFLPFVRILFPLAENRQGSSLFSFLVAPFRVARFRSFFRRTRPESSSALRPCASLLNVGRNWTLAEKRFHVCGWKILSIHRSLDLSAKRNREAKPSLRS